jgi:hypothetical protein
MSKPRGVSKNFEDELGKELQDIDFCTGYIIDAFQNDGEAGVRRALEKIISKHREKAIAAERAKAQGLVEMLQLCGIGNADPKFKEVVRELCEHIGYGNVMSTASALWAEKDPVGAHTTGPCTFLIEKALAA